MSYCSPSGSCCRRACRLPVHGATGGPDGPGLLDVHRIIEGIRKEVRGRPESRRDHHTRSPSPVPGGGQRIASCSRPARSPSSARTGTDIQAELNVHSNGYDEAEAERLAKETTAQVRRGRAAAAHRLATIRKRAGRRPKLRLKVPARLGLGIDEKNAELTITNVASSRSARGAAIHHAAASTGPVTLTQRGYETTITRCRLAAADDLQRDRSRGWPRSAVTRPSRCRPASCAAEELAGAIEVDCATPNVQFDKLEGLKGPVRVNANMGEVASWASGPNADRRPRDRDPRDHGGGRAARHLQRWRRADRVDGPPRSASHIDALSVNGTRSRSTPSSRQRGLKLESNAPPEGATLLKPPRDPRQRRRRRRRTGDHAPRHARRYCRRGPSRLRIGAEQLQQSGVDIRIRVGNLQLLPREALPCISTCSSSRNSPRWSSLCTAAARFATCTRSRSTRARPRC